MSIASTSNEEILKATETNDLTIKVRLLGLLPLIFFVAHAHYYWGRGEMANMLWMCNISNLLLAAGLLLGHREMIRVAVIWLIPGLPLWIYYVVLRGGWLLTSTFSHIGGLGIGLFALYRIRADRRTWGYALVWYLLAQQVSRMTTPAAWNINVSQIVYAGWEGEFSAYWQFWLATTLVVTAGLWALGFALLKIFPPRIIE